MTKEELIDSLIAYCADAMSKDHAEVDMQAFRTEIKRLSEEIYKVGEKDASEGAAFGVRAILGKEG